jgi:hypothetical protein
MTINIKHTISILCATIIAACSENVDVRTATAIDKEVDIYPDYKMVTIPSNIAPLNFMIRDHFGESVLDLSSMSYEFQTSSKDGKFDIPIKEWKKLLETAKGGAVEARVIIKKDSKWMVYPKFDINVSADDIDSYLAYRLIPPGYELWDEMGIYQRNLTNFDETPIIENTSTKKNCVNCHSFCMQDPDKMLLHMREKVAGTIMITDGKAEKLNTKTDQTVSALVYPSWHPSGKYVAFSTNTTNQAFHVNDRNRIEVYDTESDVVVYDVNKKEIITTEALFSKNAFETFPTFSPDGKTLYFCTAVADTMPIKYRSIKYNLCSISFDPDNRTFGNEVDTLFNAAAIDKTISFPRVSPDGRFLMFTLFDYGNFSIWHKEADLYIMDLMSGEIKPLDAVNSDDTESYHSWSSNSRWFVFSSRRHDGLYTHPYIAHIDEKGNVSKPFMLPQKDAEFYFKFMKSFNIPEMVKGKVKKSPREIALTAKDTPGTNLKFVLK